MGPVKTADGLYAPLAGKPDDADYERGGDCGLADQPGRLRKRPAAYWPGMACLALTVLLATAVAVHCCCRGGGTALATTAGTPLAGGLWAQATAGLSARKPSQLGLDNGLGLTPPMGWNR